MSKRGRKRRPNLKRRIQPDASENSTAKTETPSKLAIGAVALTAIVGLVAFFFNSIVEEPGIAWWEASPAQPVRELHVRPDETYGRIGLRNLTEKVFKNVGVQLGVNRGELVHGVFTPDARDIVPQSESRVMSVLKTGPSTAPNVLRQHIDRFDPDRTWFFDYSGNGLAGAAPAMTEGVQRENFLELKTQAKPSDTKDAQPLELHCWNWKDCVIEWRLWIVLVALVVVVVGVVRAAQKRT